MVICILFLNDSVFDRVCITLGWCVAWGIKPKQHTGIAVEVNAGSSISAGRGFVQNHGARGLALYFRHIGLTHFNLVGFSPSLAQVTLHAGSINNRLQSVHYQLHADCVLYKDRYLFLRAAQSQQPSQAVGVVG